MKPAALFFVYDLINKYIKTFRAKTITAQYCVD